MFLNSFNGITLNIINSFITLLFTKNKNNNIY